MGSITYVLMVNVHLVQVLTTSFSDVPNTWQIQ
jgi:hypothetical protein